MRDGEVFNLEHLQPIRKLTRKEKHKEYQKEYWLKVRKEIYEKIGEKCVLCDTIFHLELHEIHGKPHKAGNVGLAYIRKHTEDFVPLCVLCHRIVHALGKVKDHEKLRELVSSLEPQNNKV